LDDLSCDAASSNIAFRNHACRRGPFDTKAKSCNRNTEKVLRKNKLADRAHLYAEGNPQYPPYGLVYHLFLSADSLFAKFNCNAKIGTPCA